MSDFDDWLYDEDYPGSTDCDHIDADVDILTGLLSCHCGYSRWLSGEELRREIEIQAEAYEAYAEETARPTPSDGLNRETCAFGRREMMKAAVLKLEWHAVTLPVAPEGVRPGSEFIVDGEAVFVIRATDYRRLLDAAEGDDMLMNCENCGAWIDRDDPAAATAQDVSLCWAAATCRKKDEAMCRRDRVSEVAKALGEEAEERWRTEQRAAQRAADEAKRSKRSKRGAATP